MTRNDATLAPMAQRSRLTVDAAPIVAVYLKGIAGDLSIERRLPVSMKAVVIEALLAHYGAKYPEFAKHLREELK